MRLTCLLMFFTFLLGDLSAQDTFYVKKKDRPVIATRIDVRVDSGPNDSIVSYTVEYQREGSNIWVVAHMNGPYLTIPHDAPRGKRILFTEIIAVDANGRKYRQPDQYYNGGLWVDVNPPGK